MRPNADAERIRGLARELARVADTDVTIYLTGGEGRITVRHFDPYSQALAKIWRDFELDRADVRAMIDDGLVEPERLRELFEEIEPALFRYPSLDGHEFRSKLVRTLSR